MTDEHERLHNDMDAMLQRLRVLADAYDPRVSIFALALILGEAIAASTPESNQEAVVTAMVDTIWTGIRGLETEH